MIGSKINPELSILIPCLNEEEALPKCLSDAIAAINNNNIKAEIIVINNGSTDRSVEIIEEYSRKFPQIIMVSEERRGYGSAYLKGFEAVSGKYIFMADCDNTYDFSEIPTFLNKLKEGLDLVIGNRFAGRMDRDAMPWHKRYIGNPVLSFITRLFFKIKVHDIHCGARAITKEAFNVINLHTTGMEFASEMIIRAVKRNLKITEVPIAYRKRIGETKLETMTDGWRHLRFILLYSPLVLFFIPGSILFIVGLIFTGLFYFTSPSVFGLQLYLHPMFISATMIIIGYQFIFFAGFARIYAVTHLGDEDKKLEKIFRYITIERAGLFGIIIAIIGMIIFAYILISWIETGFGSLNQIKNSILGLVLIVLGTQTISSAFMLSILGIKEK